MKRCDGVSTWHIVTGEYPPDVGGVADYTETVAHALHASGDRVHVWTAGTAGTTPGDVTVHRVFGGFDSSDLARAGRLLDAQPHGGRILVQWVPHAFGRRGVNVSFARWLYSRSARRAHSVDVMVHEPFVPFSGSLGQRGAAIVQRAMTGIALNSAARAFVGTPAWIDQCRPFAWKVPFRWTPVPTGVAPVASRQDAVAWREGLGVHQDEVLIGSFGRGGPLQHRSLERLVEALAQSGRRARIVLVGLGSDRILQRIADGSSGSRPVVTATGTIEHAQVSAALIACDVMVQCYPDGISARHSSAAAVVAHGCSIVANEGRFTEPIWRESQAVKLVSSPDTMASAAIQLLDDRDERRRLSRAAFALYDSVFDVRHTVAALKG
jgi:glycosyltransferase involved in cell wall biosynthesis